MELNVVFPHDRDQWIKLHRSDESDQKKLLSLSCTQLCPYYITLGAAAEKALGLYSLLSYLAH